MSIHRIVKLIQAHYREVGEGDASIDQGTVIRQRAKELVAYRVNDKRCVLVSRECNQVQK